MYLFVGICCVMCAGVWQVMFVIYIHSVPERAREPLWEWVVCVWGLCVGIVCEASAYGCVVDV